MVLANLLHFLFAGLTVGAIYALVAVGLNIGGGLIASEFKDVLAFLLLPLFVRPRGLFGRRESEQV